MRDSDKVSHAQRSHSCGKDKNADPQKGQLRTIRVTKGNQELLRFLGSLRIEDPKARMFTFELRLQALGKANTLQDAEES